MENNNDFDENEGNDKHFNLGIYLEDYFKNLEKDKIKEESKIKLSIIKIHLNIRKK